MVGPLQWEATLSKEWLDGEGRATLRALYHMFERLRELDSDMPIQQALILVYVALNEGKTQAELNAVLDLPNSTMSRNIAALSSINRLNKPGLGLIKWVDHPTDRRAKHLWLTPKGRTFMARVIEAF